jgi:hypothetical protein
MGFADRSRRSGKGLVAPADVATACLPGTADRWLGRVLLEWLGLVTAFPGAGGQAALLPITDAGRARGGPAPLSQALRCEEVC